MADNIIILLEGGIIMPAWLISLLQIIGFSIVILIIFSLLKTYVLSKVKISKWIVLGAGLLIFLLPVFISAVTKKVLSPVFTNYVQMPLFVIFFLWFMELAGFGSMPGTRNDKKDDIKIRPKAKPNRIKHLKDK